MPRARTYHFFMIACLFALSFAPSAQAKAPAAPPRAKHIILMIGDGMSLENEIAASRYLFGKDEGLSFHAMPFRGQMTTWDVTTYNRYAKITGRAPFDPAHFSPTLGYSPKKGGSAPSPLASPPGAIHYFLPQDGQKKPPATDSASAATAWATGEKTDDGNLAWAANDPPGGALTTIAELLRFRLGYAIGIVSTVPFSHATPAAHVAHNKTRNDYHGIAREILAKTKPDVVIGGGAPPDQDEDTGFVFLSASTYRAIQKDPDYVMVERAKGQDGARALLEAAAQTAAQNKKLFGLFGRAAGHFASPVPADLPGTPFINRPSPEDPGLDSASLAALHVLSQKKEGFFLMIEQGDIDWANHANDYARMVGTVWDLHQAVQTIVDYVDRPGDAMDWTNTLVLVTADHANGFLRHAQRLGPGDLPTQTGPCVDEKSPCTYPNGDVSYATTQHTNELVRLYAKGAGGVGLLRKAEGAFYPGLRLIDNTQLFGVMAEAAGIPQQ